MNCKSSAFYNIESITRPRRNGCSSDAFLHGASSATQAPVFRWAIALTLAIGVAWAPSGAKAQDREESYADSDEEASLLACGGEFTPDCCEVPAGAADPGCFDATCCNIVCACDSFCCTNTWDQQCVNEATALCAGGCPGERPCGGTTACLGSCCAVHTTPGCSSGSCCNDVCDVRPSCCSTQWDNICVEIAACLCGTLCSASTICDDGNPCTDDFCGQGNTCSHSNNSLACDDGLFCNGADTCSGGSCSGHAGDPCSGADGDSDCSETCNETLNNCTANDPNGSSCNDGLFCNGSDSCSSGSCSSHVGDPCPGADGDSDCSESCNEASNNCTANDPNGSACEDFDQCTLGDDCSGGACFGTPIICDDSNPCTDDYCISSNGLCDFAPNADPCDDGDPCTLTDVCAGGVCAGTATDCSAFDDDCNVGVCSSTNGLCFAQPANELGPCDDDDPCTVQDSCADGQCFGVPPKEDCCVETPLPGCNDPACCSIVCAQDASCCDISWGPNCVFLAEQFCGLCIIIDCNTNGVDDAIDIASSTSQDCNTNGIPDECDVSPSTITEIIDATGDGTGNGLNDARGIAVDAGGNIYVTGVFTNNAFMITPAGMITEIINANGDIAGNGLLNSLSIAVDSVGNVFVTGQASDNVFKITPAGVITEIINSTGDAMGNGLALPAAVTADAAGNAYVTGSNSQNVFKITPAGMITEIIDSTGDGTGNSMIGAGDIAVDAAGNAYVTGVSSDNAFKITPTGVITEIIDATGDGLGNVLDWPLGIAVDAAGNAFVTGRFSDNAFKITPAGVITQIIDATGDGAGNVLDESRGVAVDAAGNVFVAATSSDNAFKITPAGVITEIIDASGDGAGNSLVRPVGIAVGDAGNVYVGGTTSDNAFKITPSGGSLDNNLNGIPDECETDCNNNGIDDAIDISDGTSQDCNANGVPDECETPGAVLYVDASADGANNGSRWLDAYVDLQLALNAAQPGSEIWVAKGSYVPSPESPPLGDPRSRTFKLANCVAIYGGFAGTESSRGQRDPYTNETVLSGDQGAPTDIPVSVTSLATLPTEPSRADNSYHVVTANLVEKTAVLDGFTITGGNANAGDFDPDNLQGGGLWVNSASPVIKNCRFRRNSARVWGGGLGIGGATSALIANCVIEENFAGSGGGVFFAGATPPEVMAPVMINSILIANRANAGGAMLALSDGTISLVNCTVTLNSAIDFPAVWSGFGPDFSLTNLAINVRNCIFWDNQADNAIDTSTTPFSLAHSQFVLSVEYSCIQGGWPRGVLSTLTTNIDKVPLLTPDGYLRCGSPCIDAGDSSVLLLDLGDLDENGVTNEPTPRDIDRIDERTWDHPDVPNTGNPPGSFVDMGADEFVDSEPVRDCLPDWFENRYPAAAALGAGLDFDNDKLSTLEEYEIYGSNPEAPPINVCNGCLPDCGSPADGTMTNPFPTIQCGINAANTGDTVAVLADIDEVYAGDGNYNLNFAGKSSVVVCKNGLGTATIDCGGGTSVRAVDPAFLGRGDVLRGFTIVNGNAAVGIGDDSSGGGLALTVPSFRLQDCTLTSNSAATEGGGLFVRSSHTELVDVILDGNLGPIDLNGLVEEAVFDPSTIEVDGVLSVGGHPDFPGPPDSKLVSRSANFEGVGSIKLAAGSLLHVTGQVGAEATSIRTDIQGTGDIQIDAGNQLWIKEGAVVDLSGAAPIPIDCTYVDCDTNGPAWGTIFVDGTLRVSNAAIQRTNVDVKAANLEKLAHIINTDFTLRETSPGFGGQFFVEGSSTIACNTIHSVGDRYLDMDPNPDPMDGQHPDICNNKIFVTIPKTANEHGTVLELRALDADCTTNNCPTGAFQLTASAGDSIPPPLGPQGYEGTWALEELAISADAVLNLTNRQGFDFEPSTIIPETIYVKKLVLESNAVLNTALQRLYYQTLVDENDNPLDPDLPMPNGRRIVDVPLYGFSLVNIAMDDADEFAIRVQTRIRDKSDSQPCECSGLCDPQVDPDPTACLEGSITLEPHPTEPLHDDGSNNGIMDMRTKGDSTPTAGSVAAKGAFARVGDEDIVVQFEYSFKQGDPSTTVLKIYLSDDVKVSECSGAPLADCHDGDVLVATLRPPPAERPGATDRNEFGVFWGRFTPPPGVLDFHRGTFVELELVGPDSRVLIENFDPAIFCFGSSKCADLNGGDDVDNQDFLLLLAELGQVTALGLSCLDSNLNRDQYIDIGDLLAWDAYISGPALNTCFNGLGNAPASVATPVTIPPGADLIVAAKSDEPGVQNDQLYTADASGVCTGDRLDPPAGADTRSNGRLIRDGQGNLYQINAQSGLFQLDTGEVVVDPGGEPFESDKTVYVGVTELAFPDFIGVPLLDAAFDPTNTTGPPVVVYVAPVVVVPQVVPGGCSPPCAYLAAARLILPTPFDGTWTVDELYGQDPTLDCTYCPEACVGECPVPQCSPSGCDDILLNPDKQHIRELELSADGGTLFLLSAHALAENDLLLIYDTGTGNDSEIVKSLCTEEVLGDCVSVPGPTAMLASSFQPGTLYLASSSITIPDLPLCPDTNTQIYRFDVATPGAPGFLTAVGVISIDNGAATVDPGCTGSCSAPNCFGHYVTITALAEDAGALYAAGFAMKLFDDRTAPFWEGVPDSDPAFDPNMGTIFTTPTLAILPDPLTTVPVPSSALACLDMALPLSIATVGPPPSVCSAVAARSCSNHGATRLCLDLFGGTAVEPRSGGVVSVEIDVDAGTATSAAITCVNSGAYGGVATVSQAALTVTIDLFPALPDQDTCTISLDCGASVCVRGLKGDVDRNGVVSTGDASIIKPHFGQTATAAGAEFDFDQNDIVSTGDASIVKPRFGNSAAACP